MSHRRHRAFVAAGLAALGCVALLAGCADVERVSYIALVGEAPGDKPLYTGLGPSARLGRGYPRIPEPGYRPPALPDAPAGAGDAARAARQELSDRASDYELRARYLRVNGDEYLAAVGPLRPSVGQPLPRLGGAVQTRLASARQALARIQGDILSLHGVIQRGELAKAQAERALAALKASGATNADAVAKPLADGIAAMERLLKDGDAMVGAFVEWMAEQRSALDGFEDEVRRGVATGPAILQRESIIE